MNFAGLRIFPPDNHPLGLHNTAYARTLSKTTLLTSPISLHPISLIGQLILS